MLIAVRSAAAVTASGEAIVTVRPGRATATAGGSSAKAKIIATGAVSWRPVKGSSPKYFIV